MLAKSRPKPKTEHALYRPVVFSSGVGVGRQKKLGKSPPPPQPKLICTASFTARRREGLAAETRVSHHIETLKRGQLVYSALTS